jgi:hypothetical protein
MSSCEMELCPYWHGGAGCMCDVLGERWDPSTATRVIDQTAALGLELDPWQTARLERLFAVPRSMLRVSVPSRLCIDGREYRRRRRARSRRQR